MKPSRFSNDLLWAAISLFIAIGIWLIAKQDDLEKDWLSVPVELIGVPANMEITVEPTEAALQVLYPVTVNNRIASRNFALEIDPTDVFPTDPTRWGEPTGTLEHDYLLEPSMVEMRTLPSTVHVLRFEPARVHLRARFRALRIPIEVAVSGQLPGNLSLTGTPAPDPPEVLVTGPADLLRDLAASQASIRTTTVTLDGVRGSGQMFPELILPEGVSLLVRRESHIAIDIGVTERVVTRRLVDLPIDILLLSADGAEIEVTPPEATVLIEGPGSVIDTLRPDDIVFMFSAELSTLEEGERTLGIEARLNERVPSETRARLRIVGCEPPRVTVTVRREPIEEEAAPPPAPDN